MIKMAALGAVIAFGGTAAYAQQGGNRQGGNMSIEDLCRRFPTSLDCQNRDQDRDGRNRGGSDRSGRDRGWDSNDRSGGDNRNGWGRNGPPRFDRFCSADDAIRKARRMGIFRARIIDQSQRTIEVAGRNERGRRVVITFGRRGSCPILDY